MGSFASMTLQDFLYVLFPMLLGFAVLMTQRWNLNVLSFGEEEARSLGINTGRTRLLVILAATLLSASSVAVCGVIGWIGLVVPHLTRALVGPNYRVLLPTTMFVGAIFLLIVDNFCRLLLTVEIPIGLLTSILGVPFFIFIYKRNMAGW
jgi:iron complex transport system permease protein